jgi:hypothetical protein
VRHLVPVSDMMHVVAAMTRPTRLDEEAVPSEEEEALAIDFEFARIARELKNSRRRVVGLLPTDGAVPTLDVGCELGRAIGFVTAGLVVLADPERRSVPRGIVEGAVLARAVGSRVALVTASRIAPTGDKVLAVKELLAFTEPARDHFHTLLLDLSGCAWPGELLTALSVLDGVILVGESGRTREADLAAQLRVVPPELSLGVLLVE